MGVCPWMAHSPHPRVDPFTGRAWIAPLGGERGWIRCGCEVEQIGDSEHTKPGRFSMVLGLGGTRA